MQKPKPGYKLVKSLFGKYLSIPEDWSQITIKEIVDKTIDNRGKTPPLSDRGYELIEIASITNKSKYPDFSFVTKYVDEQTYNTWFRDGHPKPNDILISTVGSVGQSVLIKENRGCIAQNIIGLEINEKVDSIFIYYLLNSKYISQYINSVLMGLAQPSLRVPHFLKCTIHIPPKTEQQKIASILSSVDDLISSYDDIIETTKLLKTGLMQTLLTKGIGHKKFKKVKWLFGKELEIPEEWEIFKISIIATQKGIKTGPFGSSLVESELNGTDVRVLFPEDIKTGCITQNGKRITKEKFEELKEFEVKSDDVIISLMGTIGKIGRVSTNIGKAIISKHLLKITVARELCLPQFLITVLNSFSIQSQMNTQSQGLTMKGLNTKIIKNLQGIFPKTHEQQKIISVLSTIDSKIYDLESKKTHLESLKKGLMQILLTGQIRVKI